MKKLLSILTLAMLAITPQAIADAHGEKKAMMEEKAQVATTAVAFHADWCGGCKILEPKMKEVMDSLDAETKAKFASVKFDFTDDTTKSASKKTAMEKGISNVFPAGEGKPPTGVVKLIDNATGTVLAKIHYKMSAEEIKGVIKAVTARS